VLPGYGSGAIMGVPAHDERDFAFASRHGLPVVEVIEAAEGSGAGRGDGVTDTGATDAAAIDAGAACYCGRGIMVNSGPYDGMEAAAGGEQITAELVGRGAAERKVNYRMRDWLISRQRYWGAPIPVIQCEGCGIVPVPEEDLPVLLPDAVDFAPSGDGRSPLARATEWVDTTCPECGGSARRETDTMDGFACSSWYYLRYTSPDYEAGPFDPQEMKRWMPVDTYVGGAEHAVMHLLYARFSTKVMYDAGMVPFVEPFKQLLNQGVMRSAVDGQRMSKSKGNVVTPDEIVAAYGTDALRIYILFLGPFEADVIWDDRGITGVARFLDRFWRLATWDVEEMAQEGVDEITFERRRQQIIKRVTEDMVRYRFNTAVAALMGYLNTLYEWMEVMTGNQWRSAVETLTLLLCPMAPFITEEVWQYVLGHTESVHLQVWPTYSDALAAERRVTIVVQVNGRVRDRVQAASGAAEHSLRELALGSAKVQRRLDGKEIRRIIVVPDRLVNIVV
jgi:leucyl-tRNA synthetase